LRTSISLVFFTGLLLAREPFTPADLWAWKTLADPQISADGEWVVYAERWFDREANSTYSNLRFVTADGKQVREAQVSRTNDYWPRWSPDRTRVAWLSDVDGATVLNVCRFDAMQNATVLFRGKPLAFAWSPDGRSIAYTAPVAAKSTDTWAPEAILPLLTTRSPAETIEIFIVPSDGGKSRQVTHDSFVRRGPPVWMPDGQWILNSAERAPDPDRPLDGAEIYGVQVATGEVRRLTEHAGPDEDPVPSPDGTKIAWIAAETKPAAYAIRKLWVMGMDGKRVKVLSGALDRDVMHPQWSSDSRTVYFLADDRGSTHVYAARNDGTVRQATSRPERLRWFSLADNGRAVAVRSNATAASEIVSFAVDLPGGVTPLATANEALLADRDVNPREEIGFQSDGKDVQAWLTRPLRTGTGKPVPLVVEAGETPREMCGTEFSLHAQIFAAAGFAVLCVNTRGTPGYGEDFGNLLRTRFPGDDYDDLMRGVDAALAKGGIEPKRVFVDGGLLAAWAIGHTDRFAGAILHRPIVDWTSAAAVNSRVPVWMGAMPWDDPDQYVKHSAIFFAQNFKTPALVIGDDPQSQELYFALEAKKVDCALVKLPKDGKPGTRLLELETELAWLRKTLSATDKHR
jgi:dipeptidyl aminopeptidase/acylaminoacyl peptidase